MDPSDVNYLSFDDEPIFDRYQRPLREHYKREDRQHIQDHLSRVLEEVKEGKRRFVRTAAFPEPSNIPVAIPLDPSLTVTVAYEPGDLNSNIMLQGSQCKDNRSRTVCARDAQECCGAEISTWKDGLLGTRPNSQPPD